MRGIALTIIYWLSNLSVAIWLGGLIATGLLLASIDPQAAHIVARAVGGPLELLDRFRPFYIGASVILIASILFSFALERDHRRSVRWWTVWVIRSAAIVGLIGVSLYGAGDTRAALRTVEASRTADMNVDRLRLEASEDGTAFDSTEVVGDTSAVAEVLGGKVRAQFKGAFTDFRASYYRWSWLEGIFAASILLIGGYREATWRKAGREKPASDTPEVGPAPAQDALPESDGESTSTGSPTQ